MQPNQRFLGAPSPSPCIRAAAQLPAWLCGWRGSTKAVGGGAHTLHPKGPCPTRHRFRFPSPMPSTRPRDPRAAATFPNLSTRRPSSFSVQVRGSFLEIPGDGRWAPAEHSSHSLSRATFAEGGSSPGLPWPCLPPRSVSRPSSGSPRPPGLPAMPPHCAVLSSCVYRCFASRPPSHPQRGPGQNGPRPTPHPAPRGPVPPPWGLLCCHIAQCLGVA